MARLIDADEAYKVLTDYYHQRTEIQHKALKEAFERVPTVDIDAITDTHERIGFDKGYREGYAQATVDAVPVVRCKDCKHFSFWCELHETRVNPEEDYCSWAEGYKRCPFCGAKMDSPCSNCQEFDCYGCEVKMDEVEDG